MANNLVLSGPLANDVKNFLNQPPVKTEVAKCGSLSTDSARLVGLLRLQGLNPQMKAQVVSFMAFIAGDPANRTIIRTVPNLFGDLLQLLDLSDIARVKEVSKALVILSASDEPNQEALYAAGGIAKFLKLTSTTKDAEVRENALKCLVYLSQNPKLKEALSKDGEQLLPQLMTLAKDKGTSEPTRRSIVQLLNSLLQQPALLTSFSKKPGNIEAIVELHTNLSLSDVTIVVLAKLTATPESRKVIAEKGGKTILTQLCDSKLSSQQATQQQQQSAAFFRNNLITLSNICVEKENVSKIISSMPDGIPKLCKLLTACLAAPPSSAESQALGLLLQLLQNITATPTGVDQLLHCGGLKLAVDLAKSPPSSFDDNAQQQSIAFLAGLLTNDEVHDTFYAAGGIALLTNKLKSTSAGVRRETAKAIGNIGQFYEDLREDIGPASIPTLVAMLSPNSDEESKKQALRALTNLALTYSNVNDMLKHTIVKALKPIIEGSNQELRFFATKLLVNLTANDKARPLVPKEIGINVVVTLLKDQDEQRQLQGLKLLTNLSIMGNIRKHLHEAKEVEKIKSLASSTRHPEIKQQVDVALGNLSFPFEKKYDDDGKVESSSESIVIPAEFAIPSFIQPDQFDYEDDDDEEDHFKSVLPAAAAAAAAAAPVQKSAPPSSPSPTASPQSRFGVPPSSAKSTPEPTRASAFVPKATTPSSPSTPSRGAFGKATAPSSPSTTPSPKPSSPSSFVPKTSSPSSFVPKTSSPTTSPFGAKSSPTSPSSPLTKAGLSKGPAPSAVSQRFSTAPTKSTPPAPTPSAAGEITKPPLPDKPLPMQPKRPERTSVCPAPAAVSPAPTVSQRASVAPTPAPAPTTKAPPQRQSMAPETKTAAAPPSRSSAAQPAASGGARSSIMGLSTDQRELHEQRTKIAREILSTETTYVTGLKMLIWKFYKPLSATVNTKKPMVNSQELKTIFSNVEIIYNYNSILLESIENRLKNWSSQQLIGDIFLKMTDYLRCYVEYVNNYQNALEVLNKIRKERTTLHTFLRKQETSKECRSLPLDGFLITPVQRIPRYELLLNDLLKHTWPQHKDYQDLAAAVAKMRETGKFINEKKRESEGLEKLFHIDNRMVGSKPGTLFEASRRWIKDGPVFRVKKGGMKPGWLHLFNDMIVVSHPTGKKKDRKFHWKGQVLIDNMTMDRIAPSGKVTNGVRFFDKGTSTEILVQTNTANEQQEWMTSVKELQNALHQKRISFRSTTSCSNLSHMASAIGKK